MSNPAYTDPAESSPVRRLFYRDWRPTGIGRWANRVAAWTSALGLSSRAAVLEVRGRASGRRRSTPVVIATVAGSRYLVSMLGPGSDWVKNVEAANGDAVLRQGRRRPIHLEAVPPGERAPILSEYVRVATSGRHHLPVAVGAPLSEFEAVAARYPVYRIVSPAR
jgi:deazaflavin-dependent oxidoreductase (nitroreductase family)